MDKLFGLEEIERWAVASAPKELHYFAREDFQKLCHQLAYTMRENERLREGLQDIADWDCSYCSKTAKQTLKQHKHSDYAGSEVAKAPERAEPAPSKHSGVKYDETAIKQYMENQYEKDRRTPRHPHPPKNSNYMDARGILADCQICKTTPCSCEKQPKTSGDVRTPEEKKLEDDAGIIRSERGWAIRND